MKNFLVALGLLIYAVPAFADNIILTAYDNNFYQVVSESELPSAPAGDLTAISDIYYYYDPVNKTLGVTQTEWIADGAGGEYPAPYDSTNYYTNVTFDNMCNVVGYCDETFQNKISEMRTEYETYLSNSANNKYASEQQVLDASKDYTDKKINFLERELSAGIASTAAMSSIEVSNVNRGEVSIGGGYGYYNSQSAVAFGAAMGLTDNWSVNAAAGFADSNVSCRAGTNYKFKLF